MTDSVSETTAAVIVARDQRVVALRDVGIARENLRFDEPPDEDIPLLAATLKAAGQLQPLTVRPGRGRKERALMALDGRRRRLALGLLLEAGDIDENYPVCVYVETDPARQAAAVLLTNTAVPVHVADVIAAIGRMLKSKLTVSAIAKALGYAEIEVKRLAALAGLPPVALVALKAGRMSLKQARLLARLPDKDEQSELAQAALDGCGFQEWRLAERLDIGRVTARDRRYALVGSAAYAEAGGRTEADLFGELAPVLLDPDILTRVWMNRAREIAAVFEDEGLAVHVAAGPEPDLPNDLEALGYVYGGRLSREDMARYRALREAFDEEAETVRDSLAALVDADQADLAVIAMIRARLAMDQAGSGGRLVTTMVMSPAAGTGVDVRCYTPEEPRREDEEAQADDPVISKFVGSAFYTPPEVEAPDPDTEGVNHALHGVRTDVATRGLIRALAGDPEAALTALIARLFNLLVARINVARSDAALAIIATGFSPSGGRVIEALDGEVRQRLDDRRAAWEASGETVIAWVHALPPEDRMGLLAEMTALSLDLREERTSMIRHRARAEAAELAALCGAAITRHWTPDAPFLQSHSKGQLLDMLESMGSPGEVARTLKKTELVDWVAEQAAARNWAPASLSWTRPPEAAEIEDEAAEGGGAHEAGDGDEDGAGDKCGDGAGDFVVTPAGEAAIRLAVA